jgi:His/Glu/Gln/Arg/opine family amino acid ABC transporter permease subunit
MSVTAEIFYDLVRGGVVTVEIAISAWAVAAAMGLVLAVLRDLGGAAVRTLVVSLITMLRSLPQLVVLYLLYFGVGALGVNVNSLVAAILALGITESAFTAEYYRAGFMTVPDSQREAGRSLGLSALGVFRLIVMPQTIPFVVPPLLNAFVGLLKTATLAAAGGAPEVLYRGQNDMTRTGLIVPIVIVIIGLYVLVTIPLARAVAFLERRARAYAHA